MLLCGGDGAKLRPKLVKLFGTKFKLEFRGELAFILIPPKLSSRSEEGDRPAHWFMGDLP